MSERVNSAAQRTTTLNERTMRRVSSDLHDGPGQMLSLAILRLDGLRTRAAAGRPPSADELAEVEEALREAMTDMRGVAAGLRVPELAPLDVEAVALAAVRDHERRSGAQVTLDAGRRPGVVSLPVKIALFRALQEGLSNATRHGGSSASTCAGRPLGRPAPHPPPTGRAGSRPGARRPRRRRRLRPGVAGIAPRASGLAGIREQAEILGGDVRRSAPRHGRARGCASGGPSRAGRKRREHRHRQAAVSDAIRVAVADDHPMFRAGVVASLREVEGIEVVGEADDAASALALARAELPDVIILDIAMPGGGLAAAREIATACPATRIVMLTVSEDEDDLLAAVKAGASGYVLKGAGAGELVERHPLGQRRRGVRRAGPRLGHAARAADARAPRPSTSSPSASARSSSWWPRASATRRSATGWAWPRRPSSTT